MSFFSAKNDVSSGPSEDGQNQELAAWRDPAKDQAQNSLGSFYVEAECESPEESSDDDVCFGEYTMEEAKKDVKRNWARPITKRHSSICRFKYLDVNKEMDAVTNQFADLLTNPSQDVTSNEYLEVDGSRNSEFLHKLEKCINDPISGHTSYNTAFDQTNMDKNGDNPEQESCPDDSIISVSDDSSSQLHTSGYEFVNEDSASPAMIYMREEGQELTKEAIKNDDSFRSAMQTSFVNRVEVDKVDPRLKLDFNHLSGITEKTEFTSEFVSFSSNSDASSNIPVIQINDGTGSSYENLSGSFISEASENQLNVSTSSVKNDYFTTASSEDKIAPSSTLPPSDLSSYEDEKNNSIDFDDTLEEMNRFLAQGMDYIMPEKTTVVKNVPLLEQNLIVSPISGSFENDSDKEFPCLETKPYRNCYSVEKVSAPKPTAKTSKSATKPKFVSKIKLPTVTKKLGGNEANAIFKVPNKPIRTPSKLNPALKNVVSPVGIYIKHSPKVCPMRNAPPPTKLKLPLYTHTSHAISSSHKENIPASEDFDMPTVIYKPARKQIATEVRQVNLPNSINKLVNPQVVTKHEARTDNCNQSIERRLMESDYSINLSLDTTAGDVSILTHNQPFNLKKF
ncbi:unnamed protein product [Ceutorhynchus assimilis]|uniref:Uncharacterized protein n=1 Tax=Ceutorhynchus assimilis TaxID=467358 RepID=A0A9P0DHZ6_9CUCU|nr:unnamed protein product [Ceutorhynchus assimilis]